MSFARLDAHCRSLEALDHALAILGADEATHMAPGGGEKRAEAMAALSGMAHAQATKAEVRDWLESAKGEDLEPLQKVAVRELERSYTNATCLPTAFVERQTLTRMKSEQFWRSARERNDWAGFAPLLADVIELVREEAAMRADVIGLAPYDAMMEQYDPGNRVADIDPVFVQLKSFLKGFAAEAIEDSTARKANAPKSDLSGPFAVEAQRKLGLAMMEAVGFDLNRGSLSVSHHPFCGGVPSDVRLTTRYRTDDFLSALMGILHETGHGLYEQNLPQEGSGFPSGKARGMAIHESQSLFVEKQIGRNPAFWCFALPHVEKHLGVKLTLDEILPHIHQVERGFIRVDADEVTYPLHVILRYELEQDLMARRIEVRDLPEAWHSRMRDYLGLSTQGNPKDGEMQDVHWAAGLFGYFPSYTLGAMMAAQQFAAIERKHPQVNDDIARGDFSIVNDWRREHIWSVASTKSTPEIMRDATGEPLNATHFIAHLKARYGA